jgi:hypothetical protein
MKTFSNNIPDYIKNNIIFLLAESYVIIGEDAMQIDNEFSNVEVSNDIVMGLFQFDQYIKEKFHNSLCDFIEYDYDNISIFSVGNSIKSIEFTTKDKFIICDYTSNMFMFNYCEIELKNHIWNLILVDIDNNKIVCPLYESAYNGNYAINLEYEFYTK